MPDNQDMILGVDRDIVEQFLALILEKYPKVDEANYFIEHNVHTSGINVAITNQRDVLSHLCTVMSQNGMSRTEKIAQIALAEEHFRRAIIESYERAATILNDMVLRQLDTYKSEVLPIANQSVMLSAPTLESLRSGFQQIAALRDKGRKAKARNQWDAEWEEGVASLVKAFSLLRDSQHIMEQYIIRAVAVKEHRKNKTLHWLAIGLGIGALVATIAIFAIQQMRR
jgi:hypothetical protein